MGKAKKAKLKKLSSAHNKRSKSNFNPSLHPNGIDSRPKSKTKHSQASQAPSIPFSTTDRILLIGEGDFSFALSLATHHACTALTATTLETHASLIEKHPRTAEHLETLLAHSVTVLYGIDATKLGQPLPSGGGSAIRKHQWDRIIFNFPHTGGLTKDVNRQVRANQQLLVGFFERAKPLLTPCGTIIVTIFEGEPYTLWNIRDLGRHVGLKVERSMKFDRSLYPGYKHARTLGDVRGGGGWKGEERPARMYIFTKKEEENGPSPGGGSGANMEALGIRGGERTKRKREDDSSEEGEDNSDS